MIYIHIPYCRSFCTYCDFYSEIAVSCPFSGFAEAVSAEIKARSAEIAENRAVSGVDTLYIGGGTPSVLPLSVLKTILSALETAGAGTHFKEFTVEVNPEDIVEKGNAYVEGLLEAGVNRISMGVQSFDDGILKWMNRRHDSTRVLKAYSILEETGVENISIDLIFGLPQLSDSLWQESIDKALSLHPAHISAYQLSVEPGSALARMCRDGKWQEASEEVCARQYDMLCRSLVSAGFHHYEISNFARPGFEALHNSAYWKHIPYVGLGPGAHSFLSPDMRRWNNPDLSAYLSFWRDGLGTMPVGSEKLSSEQLDLERLMLGLRTSDGVSGDFVRTFCGAEKTTRAIAEGNLQPAQGQNLRIPESRFFISDSILSDLL